MSRDIFAGQIIADVSVVCLKCERREPVGCTVAHHVSYTACKQRIVAKGWRKVGAWGFACPDCEGSYRITLREQRAVWARRAAEAKAEAGA